MDFQRTDNIPFALSLPFDRLRMIGNKNEPNTQPTPFGLSLSKPCLAHDGTSTSSVRTASGLCFEF